MYCRMIYVNSGLPNFVLSWWNRSVRDKNAFSLMLGKPS